MQVPTVICSTWALRITMQCSKQKLQNYSTNDTQIANISKEALSKVVAQKKLVALTFR